MMLFFFWAWESFFNNCTDSCCCFSSIFPSFILAGIRAITLCPLMHYNKPPKKKVRISEKLSALVE